MSAQSGKRPRQRSCATNPKRGRASNTYICADAFVGPGVPVNGDAILGAAVIVLKDAKPWMIVVGKPAPKS